MPRSMQQSKKKKRIPKQKKNNNQRNINIPTIILGDTLYYAKAHSLFNVYCKYQRANVQEIKRKRERNGKNEHGMRSTHWRWIFSFECVLSTWWNWIDGNGCMYWYGWFYTCICAAVYCMNCLAMPKRTKQNVNNKCALLYKKKIKQSYLRKTDWISFAYCVCVHVCMTLSHS